MTKLPTPEGGRGEFAGRNESERRYSIVKSIQRVRPVYLAFSVASLSFGGEA